MSTVTNPEPQVNNQAANGPPISRKQAVLRDPANKPEPLPCLPDYIPAELRELVQWIVWSFVWIKDRKKWDKPPTNPTSGKFAEANNPTTWAPFPQAIEYAQRHDLDGVGFVFSADDPYAGIDLDDCRDPDTGEIAQWALYIITEFNTYTEVSPTGTGVKLFVRGIVGKGIKTPTIELYDRGRYFTMTGHRVPNTPETIAEAQPQLDRLIARLRPKRGTSSTSDAESSPLLTDEQVIARARSAKNGAKFSRLWDGDTTGYPSASEADLALCSILSFWTHGKRAQIDRLFRQSKLFREKWDEKHHGDGRTYGEGTLDTALARVPKVQPSPNASASANQKASTSSAAAASETLDDVTLSVFKPRRTNTGTIRASLVISRNRQQIDEIPISNTPSNRDMAAKQIMKYLPNVDRLKIDAALTRLVTLAGQLADNPLAVEGEKMHVIVARVVKQYYDPKYRTPDGFYAERLGGEITYRKFIAHIPSVLVSECAGASDAPVRIGGVHRGALLKAIEVELKIFYSDLIETLDPAIDADLDEKSSAAKEFRTNIIKVLTARKTFEAPKNDTDRPRQASLMSRAARMVEEDPKKGFRRWLRILDGVYCWLRFRLAKDGEVQVWFAIRWECANQLGVPLPGVGDENTLTVLGTKFGIIDRDPPLPAKVSDGKVRLSILRRDFTQPLLDAAGDFDDYDEPAPASQAEEEPKATEKENSR